MPEERGSVQRLLLSLIVVSLAVTGLASPSAADDGYPPPPPPEECDPDCPPPPPAERYECPRGFTRVPMKVELDQPLEVEHQFSVGGREVSHAGLETQKYLLVEICVEHAGQVAVSVANSGNLQVLGMCVQLALGLEATAGPPGGTIKITGQVLASSQDFVEVGVDSVDLSQETPPADVRFQESYELDVSPYTTQKVDIRHSVCLP